MEKGSKSRGKEKKSRLSSLSDKQYQYIGRDTRQEVYDALYALETILREDSIGTLTPQSIGKNAKVPDIRWWLDERRKEYNKQIEADGWAYYKSGHSPKTEAETRIEIEKAKRQRTISDRHIERILKTDSRIVKGEGNTYHIDKEARFETRYQRPDMFGHDMLDAVMEGFSTTRVSRTGKQSKIPDELVMLELGRRFAAVIQFSFIEAARPFKDNCLSLRERNELVNHWKNEAILIDEMFSMFVGYLAHHRMATELDENLAPEELDECDINKMLEAFKKAYPDLYENLMDARKQQPFSLDEVSRREKEQIGWVHGKTYHSGWREYYNYLEKINPVAYRQQMERIEKESKKVKYSDKTK